MLSALIAFLIIFLTSLNPAALFAQDVVIYGDTRTNHAIHRKVIAVVLSKKPSIVFHTGDLVENGLDPQQWAIFNSIASKLIQTVEFYPALGNHEHQSKLFFDNFVLPNNERWYSVERNGIHFIVLDTNSKIKTDSKQYKWLESDLGSVSDKVKFTIVILHHSPFTTTRQREDEKGLRRTIVPLFEKYGVDVVFSSHFHSYERFLYNGIYYIVTGGGGAPFHHQVRISPCSQLFITKHHFCILSVADNQLVVSVFDLDLNLLDQFKIESKADRRSE